MNAISRLTGLVAATHTPFRADGALHLPAVEAQAGHLLAQGVTLAFVGGTTGESHSLRCDERAQLAARWFEVTRGTPLRVIVHVGANCLADACALAAQADAAGALAVAAVAPSYFKPPTVGGLITCCAEIAGAAPGTPFYYYEIPPFTGLDHAMPVFLERARESIPTLAGIKFSHRDLMSLQLCLEAHGGAYDILFGIDEALLAALALGVRGAVGSSYNFAAPLYHRLIRAFAAGDLATARREQLRSVHLIGLLARYGYLAASKAVMGMLGVPVGPTRLPLEPLTDEQVAGLRQELEALGFFEWVAATG